MYILLHTRKSGLSKQLLQSRRPRALFRLSYGNLIKSNRSQYNYYSDWSKRAQGLINQVIQLRFPKRLSYMRWEITQKKMLQKGIKKNDQLLCPSTALKNTTRTLFHLNVPRRYSCFLRPHDMTFSLTQRKTETHWTLPQNPQKSINMFLSLGRGGEEGEAEVWNLKYFWSLKTSEASDAVTNMYVPPRIYFLN